MQEFCPLCTKNGMQNKVRALQLNFEEAVFMCPNEECPWPIGSEELIFINRPAVSNDWNKDWDQTELEYFKKEQVDPVFELSTYTPPQTPGTEVFIKDAVTTISEKVINPMFKEENVNIPNNFFTDISASLNLAPDNSSDRSVKPKLISISQPLSYNVQKLPSKGYILKKNDDNSLLYNNKQINQFKKSSNPTLATSTNNTSLFVRKWVYDSAMINSSTETPKENTKILSKKRLNTKLSVAFDFEEIKKSKSTNLGKVQVENKKPSETNACDSTVKKCKLVRVKKEKKSSSVMKEFDFHNFDSKKVLDPVYENNSSHNPKPGNQNVSEVSDFNLDDFVNQHCTSNCNENFVDVEKNHMIINNSVDADYTLSLSTSSLKDSGVDQDSIDLNVSIDGLLADLDYYSPQDPLSNNENLDTQISSNENSVIDDKFNNELSNSEADFIQSLYS